MSNNNISESDSDDMSLFIPARARLIKRQLELSQQQDSQNSSSNIPEDNYISKKQQLDEVQSGKENVTLGKNQSQINVAYPVVNDILSIDSDDSLTSKSSCEQQNNQQTNVNPAIASENEANRLLQQIQEESKRSMSENSAGYWKKLVDVQRVASQVQDLNNQIQILHTSSKQLGTMIEVSDESSTDDEFIDMNPVDISQTRAEEDLSRIDRDIEKQVDKEFKYASITSLQGRNSLTSDITEKRIIPEGCIAIKVRNNDTESDKDEYIIKNNDSFSVLMDNIKQKKNVNEVNLYFDGDKISSNDTPQDYDMENDELIEAKFETHDVDPLSLVPDDNSIMSTFATELKSYFTPNSTMNIYLIIDKRQIKLPVPKTLELSILYQVTQKALHWDHCILKYKNKKLSEQSTFQKSRVIDSGYIYVTYDKCKK